MKRIALYTPDGSDREIVGWELIDTQVSLTDPTVAAVVDLDTIPNGFELNWMDYLIENGAIKIQSDPQHATEKLERISNTFPPSLVRMNTMNIFKTL